jgi:hypothetical protein
MTTLDELRAKVTAEQGIILNTIWRHFAQAEDQNESWIRAGILYHRLGKGQKEQTVHATLATLGGTIVYETTDYGNGRRYGLTFLGMLLTEQGLEIESMLGKALGRIRDLFLENPSGKINVKGIAKDIGLNETQSSLLLRVFPLSGFFSGGGSLDSAGWPREIDDLVHIDDFEAHIREEAMQKFDPSVPVDSDPVSRALYAAAVEEYRQSISKNDQLGRVPMIGARSVGRESVPTMQIESSGNNSVAAHTIIGSNIYIGADAVSSAEKRTPAQEFEYRSKKRWSVVSQH